MCILQVGQTSHIEQRWHYVDTKPNKKGAHLINQLEDCPSELKC